MTDERRRFFSVTCHVAKGSMTSDVVFERQTRVAKPRYEFFFCRAGRMRALVTASSRLFIRIIADVLGRHSGVSRRHFLSMLRLLPHPSLFAAFSDLSISPFIFLPTFILQRRAALPDLFVSRVAAEAFILILPFVRPVSSLGGGVGGLGCRSGWRLQRACSPISQVTLNRA